VTLKVPAAFDRGLASPTERAALFESLCVVLGAMHQAGMLEPAARLTDAPPPTFGVGAAGPLVGVWQTIVGAKRDDSFGPKTAHATAIWATAAGFGKRESVTPAMWATAIGVTVLFDVDAVLLPDGARLSLEAAAADARAALEGP